MFNQLLLYFLTHPRMTPELHVLLTRAQLHLQRFQIRTFRLGLNLREDHGVRNFSVLNKLADVLADGGICLVCTSFFHFPLIRNL